MDFFDGIPFLVADNHIHLFLLGCLPYLRRLCGDDTILETGVEYSCSLLRWAVRLRVMICSKVLFLECLGFSVWLASAQIDCGYMKVATTQGEPNVAHTLFLIIKK